MALFREYLTNETGGGNYYTPEEDELFREKTFDALAKLEEMGWRIEEEEPYLSGTLYQLWSNGRERLLYLSEKKLYKGKATIGKYIAAQQRMKILRHRGAPKEELWQQAELISQLGKALRESEEHSELFEQIDLKPMDFQKFQYKTLNDAANVHEELSPYLRPGKTEIWYMRPEFFRDFSMGLSFLLRHGSELSQKLKVTDIPSKTHVLLGKIKEYRLEKIFYFMQGEIWSPYGEANSLIKKKGLHHTSMSVGDIIKIKNRIMIVEKSGFKELNPKEIIKSVISTMGEPKMRR